MIQIICSFVNGDMREGNAYHSSKRCNVDPLFGLSCRLRCKCTSVRRLRLICEFKLVSTPFIPGCRSSYSYRSTISYKVWRFDNFHPRSSRNILSQEKKDVTGRATGARKQLSVSNNLSLFKVLDTFYLERRGPGFW